MVSKSIGQMRKLACSYKIRKKARKAKKAKK